MLKVTFLNKKAPMNQKQKQHKAEQIQLLLRQQAAMQQPQHQQHLIVKYLLLQVFVNLLVSKVSTSLK
ncbi:hypothetical protein D3C76_1677290 [compost metagenome]